MKVKELIEVLNQQDPELLVALVCDHGQAIMRLEHTETALVFDPEDYMMETCTEKEAEESGSTPTKVFVLEAY